MSKARTLANLISDNAELADGQISVAEVVGAAPLANPSFTGNITVSGNVDGRDIAADGTKLNTIETNADVTDASNVTAAGALMDSELTNIAAIKALNQGVATTDEVAFDNTTLNAIAKDISDTAVDVFVYDTSKDSDGGAWRKRTQATSWYNETLNTATRGSRKEFPAVAVIVAETDTVTIYDGDDPDLPMWMVFGYGVFGDISNTKAVSAINGIVAVGSTARGIPVANFVSDYGEYQRNSGSHTLVTGGLSNRNSFSFATGSAYPIVNSNGNDVAMTVLPNAPIDYATGLPVPTIAAATDGGVSVIKDDGTVVDITGSGSNTHSVTFAGNDLVMATYSNTDIFRDIHVYYDFSTDITKGGSYTKGSADEFYTLYSPLDSQADLTSFYSTNGYALLADDDKIFIGTSAGLQKINRVRTNPSTGISALITSTYNTGWMNGDIKLATLSDTDDTDVTSTELVTNGTFDSDITSWTLSDAGGTIVYDASGAISLTGGSGTVYASQPFTTVSGKRYELNITGPSSGNIHLAVGTSENNQSLVYAAVTGTKTFTFTASSTTTHVTFREFSGTGPTLVSNISVRLIEEDRSVNNNGLIVNGTVTKTPVATGADLVAYSGFSASNYLQQPYNSDLDFGTGDFCVMGWVKPNSISGSDYILSRNNFGVTGFEVYINNSAGLGLTTAGQYFQQGSALPDNTWSFFCIKRVGTTAYMYINGEQVNSTGNSANLSVNLPLIIGNEGSKNNPFSGSLALFRISGTAPTPEQIAKIYRDEKHLFQENAKATLYGTSDAVTALAHDDTTDLLHVGTSAGRSVFQGLRRVDNTTTAVGATISASNGLVAED